MLHPISPVIGHRAVSAAAPRRKLEIIQMLVKRGVNVNPLEGTELFTPLVESARVGSLEIVKYLIAHGARLDISFKGRTVGDWALYRAACGGHTGIMSFLINHGVVVDDRPLHDDLNGHTLLCGAALRACRDSSSIQILLQHGASIDARCGNNRTALGEAVKREQFEVVSFLLGQGAEVNAQESYDFPFTIDKTRWRNILRHFLDAGAHYIWV